MNLIPYQGYASNNLEQNYEQSINMQNEMFQTYSSSSSNFNEQNMNLFYEFANPNSSSEIIVPDFPDACLKFINDILMEEEDFDDLKPNNLLDFHALQATEQSLYDALGTRNNNNNNDDNDNDNDNSRLVPVYPRGSNENVVELNSFRQIEGRRNRERENEEGDVDERRSKYISTSNNDEYVEMEKFDDILICEEGKDDISPSIRKVGGGETTTMTKSRRKTRRGKGESTRKAQQVVDLRNLLIQCAQEAASSDVVNATDLLRQIREHASAYGDSAQRVAYYFANGLEARMAGMGSDMYREFAGKAITSVEILKAYKLYVSAVPFQRTTYYLANQTIAKLAVKATKIHIIDFGIFLGFQWPGLIQMLSKRRVGPPKLRITGVDYPMRGFKPAQKVQETGNRLAGYCERFGVPFEFQAIAQRWDTLKPEDFKIEKDELVIVSCLYQSGKLPDESVDVESPRDYFLKLIRTLNADLFIHGVVNGTFNAPFFITRFREALYHYSALFDVFEATIPREDPERLSIERFLYGKDAMNIVACEGSERIERPESYKQWQMRHQRVGFTQVPLNQEVVQRARAMVKANYHKDFMVEQDKEWMVQGWKGRILSAVSCWKPS